MLRRASTLSSQREDVATDRNFLDRRASRLDLTLAACGVQKAWTVLGLKPLALLLRHRGGGAPDVLPQHQQLSIHDPAFVGRVLTRQEHRCSPRGAEVKSAQSISVATATLLTWNQSRRQRHKHVPVRPSWTHS